MPSLNLAIGAGNQAGGLYEANILNVSYDDVVPLCLYYYGGNLMHNKYCLTQT